MKLHPNLSFLLLQEDHMNPIHITPYIRVWTLNNCPLFKLQEIFIFIFLYKHRAVTKLRHVRWPKRQR